MTTIQIINYGAVEFHVADYGTEKDGMLWYKDVGRATWNKPILIRDAKGMGTSDIVEGYLIPALGCDDSWLEIDEVDVNTNETFIKDEAKMRDFLKCSKDEFLFSYSYITEEEYNATYEAVMNLIGQAVGWDVTIAEEFGCSVKCPYYNMKDEAFTCKCHKETLPCEE